jgi:hypothetical protein
MGARTTRARSGDRELSKRVTELERKYDRLLDGFERWVKRARR